MEATRTRKPAPAKGFPAPAFDKEAALARGRAVLKAEAAAIEVAFGTLGAGDFGVEVVGESCVGCFAGGLLARNGAVNIGLFCEDMLAADGENAFGCADEE